MDPGFRRPHAAGCRKAPGRSVTMRQADYCFLKAKSTFGAVG